MVYSVIVGIVIVALGVSCVLYTLWQDGSPVAVRRRERHDGVN